MIAKTKYGKIEGIERETYTEFRGIPYAKAPVGALRWRAPQKPEPWEGIYEAKQFAHRSMQRAECTEGFYGKEFRDDPDFITAPSEDSLYLNIWTPAKNENEKLPVAFWIHGGAFMGGCGHDKQFDGEAFAKRGVVTVTINYRMGVYGFFAHPWLSAESEHGVSGNYGILDQIEALNWVYENIAAFGGDPEAITCFGQSAGAMSVQTLISSPLTGDRIRRAIMQSGGGYKNQMNRNDFTLKMQEEYGKELTELAGVSSLSELRGISEKELYELAGKWMMRIFPKAQGLFLVPVVDGYVLPEGYDTLQEKGMLKTIPYMIGSNKDDDILPVKGEEGPLYQGCIGFAGKMEENEKKPVYVYYFTRDLPGDDAGAFHSAELWYMFGTMKRSWRPFTEHDYALSERMVDYWTNFIKTGNPNGTGFDEKELELWRSWSSASPEIKIFK